MNTKQTVEDILKTKGYQYGTDAMEHVITGFEIAVEHLRKPIPTAVTCPQCNTEIEVAVDYVTSVN